MVVCLVLLFGGLVLGGLAGWRFGWWTGRCLVYLLWLVLAAGVGLCELFHLWPGLAPALLARQLDPVAARMVEEHPLFGLLGQCPWLVLGIAGLSAAAPPLLRLQGRLRRSSSGKAPAAAPRRARRVCELSAEDTPTPGVRPAAGAPLDLRVGLVGPWRGGKSELIDQACVGLSRLALSHGLRLDVEDPRQLNGLLLVRRRLDAKLSRQPRLTTVQRRAHPLALLEAGQARLRLELHDPVGQLVHFTTPTAPAELQLRCDGYQQHLASIDVLWRVLPCPSRQAGLAERRAFLDAVQTTTAYVRAALNQRGAAHPLALALVLTRIDARYDGEADARGRLPQAVLSGLARQLWPLRGHPGLGEVVLAPVSAWGFGTAAAGPGRPAAPTGLPDEPGPTWLLRPGHAPRPYNVAALVLWSLAAAVGCRTAPADSASASELVRLHRLLVDELARPSHWIVPLLPA